MPVLLLLSDEDRKRFGCGETLTVSLSVSAREAAEMQRPFYPNQDGELEGFADPAEWRDGLRGTPMFDRYGAPVMVDEEEELPDGSFKTVQVQRRQPNFGANLALVWLALKRADVQVSSLREFDFDASNARFYTKPDGELEGPGKDGGAAETTSPD